MEKLSSLERRLVAVEKALLTILLVALVSLSFLQVVLRGFERGLLWADTFLRYLVLWIGFFGAAVAAAEEKHFAMDAATRLLGPRLQKAVRAACNLLVTVVCGLMTFASWRFLLQEREAGSILFTLAGVSVKGWALETILPAGFLLLGAHFALRAAIGVPMGPRDAAGSASGTGEMKAS